MKRSILLFLALCMTLMLATAVSAKSKFKNKDTAKNRTNYSWGTRSETGHDISTTYGKDATRTSVKPPKQDDDVNWSDKINMNIDVNATAE